MTYLGGTAFICLATLGSVVPLRLGKWVPTSGAIGQIVLLIFFTASVAVYGFRNGIHGVALTDFTPSAGVLIAVVPVLIYSFVGVELPATAAEEMLDPRRDIPVAIARAGAGQALMYAIPTLAVLVVLPAGQITSLHGFIDAMKAVYTVYGGSVAVDGSVTLSGAGLVLGVISAAGVHLGADGERLGVDHGCRTSPGGGMPGWRWPAPVGTDFTAIRRAGHHGRCCPGRPRCSRCT